ncbi:potassium channel family protein [Ectobacillus ponti]|uniref:Potassium channel family protein n=1 Tax=Ectobacillus ponti TaxID=2961894 RepID=A0AA42BS34_9BACI|nr:potassium channel family protein [Ectobacillus ponti]MCP8970961.1 potassium channel family protein [Ectobacillus ponti]
MIWVGILMLAGIATFKSLQMLWRSAAGTRNFFSFYNLSLLVLIYSTVLIAFGIGYLVLEEMGFAILEEDGKMVDVHSFQMVEICMYFSAITLLSVGYGDITPVGFGRWIAIIEAMVGYTMPFALVMRTVMEHENRQ